GTCGQLGYWHAFSLEHGAQIGQRAVIRHNGDTGSKLSDLLGQEFYVPPSDQRIDTEAVRPHANHIQCAGTYRSGGSENREERHPTPMIASGCLLAASVFFGKFLF